MTNEGHNYITLTTGVLRKHPDAEQVRMTALNRDPDDIRLVTFAVIDWTTLTSPTPLSVPAPNPVTLNPVTAADKTVSLSGVDYYEVLFTVPNDADVVVNTWSEDSYGNLLEGNTLYHNELVKLAQI